MSLEKWQLHTVRIVRKQSDYLSVCILELGQSKP